MNISSKTLLTISIGLFIMFILPNMSDLDYSLAQPNSAIGQEGDEDRDVKNNAYQNEDDFINTEQDSMCISGESNLFSCNNDNIEKGVENDKSIKPFSLEDKTYEIIGEQIDIDPDDFVTSIAECNLGDSVLGGGFIITNHNTVGSVSSKAGDSQSWEVTVGGTGFGTVTATAICFDNP